jgi:hypothetical protein
MVLIQDKAVVSRLAQGHRAMLNQKMSKDIATTRPKRGICKNILNCSDKTLGFFVLIETKREKQLYSRVKDGSESG